MSTLRSTLIPGATVLAAGLAFLLGGVGAAGTARAADVSVEVSPTTDVPADGGEITVSGSGFDLAGPGIYVGLAAKDGFDPADSESFGAVVWVKPGGPDAPGMATLQPDGTFEVTLEVPAVFGEGENAVDCRETQCAIHTLAAHGSPDRSQDTVTDLTFAGGEPAGSTPEAVAATGASGSEGRDAETAAEESSSSTGLIIGVVVAVLVIAILGYVLLSRRRSGGAGSTA